MKLRSPVGCRVARAALIALALAGSAGACRDPGAATSPRSFAVDERYEVGNATLRLRVDRVAITVAESVYVALTLDLPAGAAATLPEGPATSGGFTLVDSGSERRAAAGGVRIERWYRLEPFLSGDYAVEPFAVEVADPGGARRTVTTARVKVAVSSLLPADYQRLDIRDIEGILRSPWRPPWWVWLLVGVLAAAGAGTAAFLWWQRRRLERAGPPPRPPHVVAYEEIDTLVAEDLVSRGDVKLFYQRVTGILRRYIERRFGLRAPERTTEEFLREIGDTAALSEELKRLLRAFLQHADLVKFAQLRPLGDEIRGTLDSCRDFVRATEPPPPEEGERAAR